jgi:uncharacterized membrane protein
MGSLEKIFISLLGTAFFGLLFALLAWINVFSGAQGQWKLIVNVVILGVMLVAAIGAITVIKITTSDEELKDNS